MALSEYQELAGLTEENIMREMEDLLVLDSEVASALRYHMKGYLSDQGLIEQLQAAKPRLRAKAIRGLELFSKHQYDNMDHAEVAETYMSENDPLDAA